MNLFWAFFYNFICVIIATGIFYYINSDIKINPMIGSLAMSISSVSVVLNVIYRIAKDEETAERIAAKIYNGEIDERGFRKLTRSLYPDVAAVYGWKIAGQKNVV